MMVRKVLLSCGIVAAILYLAADVVGALRFPGYRYADQTVSELIAVDAPTRPLLVVLGLFYALLWFAFGAGIWRSASAKWALRVVAAGLVAKEVLGTVVTWFFPMHLRAVLAAGGATYTDTWHANLTALGILCFLTAIAFGSTAFGKGFRLYSIATVLVLVVFGTLGFLDAPRMAANLPTPWMGVWERINIYGYFLWSVVLAIKLLRAPVPTHKRAAEAPGVAGSSGPKIVAAVHATSQLENVR